MDNNNVQNILLVDDISENLTSLEYLLEQPGRNIIKALSGEEALGYLLKEDISLILLDVQMPNMDGFETASLIRGSKKTKHIPIIFVSAINKEQKHVFKGYESGAVDYVFKPLNPDIMRSKVNIFLELDEHKKTIIQQNKKLTEAKRNTDNILANVKEGILLLDKNLIIKPQYSAALEHILEMQELGEKNLLELLKNKISEGIYKGALQYFEILFQSEIPENVVEKLNIFSTIEYNNDQLKNDSNLNKHLSFIFKRIYQQQNVEELMVTIIDQTNEILLKKKLALKERQVKNQMEWLVHILQIEPPLIHEFIDDVGYNLNYIKKLIKTIKKGSCTDIHKIIDEIYRKVHTIKGNASLLDLDYFRSKAHEYESVILMIKKQENIQRKDIVPLILHLRYLQNTLIKLKQLIKKISKYYNHFTPEDESNDDYFMLSLENLVEKLSKSSDKKIEFNFNNFQSNSVPNQYKKDINNILIQLINNAIHHGIESPDQRIKNDKNPVGQIKIESFKDNKTFALKFRDDGRGFQLDKIKTHAISTGKYSADELDVLDDTKIIDFIFLPGFSTAEKTSFTAGRGMGLDIVRNKIMKHKGNIKAYSEKGKFSEFKITFPS